MHTWRFLSTLSLRRATINTYHRIFGGGISIHALLAESDGGAGNNAIRKRYFYPRSPCGERRGPQKTKMPSGSFLSTLSLRRATISCALSASRLGDFYPRSPCGERPGSVSGISSSRAISIHALLAESDAVQIVIVIVDALFLSTLSLRRATTLI